MDSSTVRLLVIFVLIFGVVSAVSVTTLVLKKEGSRLDEAQVEKIIYEYLKKNPEVIVNAYNEAMVKREQEEYENSMKVIVEKKEEIHNDPTTPYVGSAEPDVTIVEFFDYNCGYCKKVTPDLMKLMEEDKKLKVVLKDFPILGPQSVENAKAAIAFAKLNKERFFDFHVNMMKTTPRNNEQVFAMAEKYGVRKDDLQKAMEDQSVIDLIRKNMALAESIGVRGTPAFVVNGKYVRGAVDIDTFKRMIAEARGKKDNG